MIPPGTTQAGTEGSAPPEAGRSDWFVTTRWSVVLAAGREDSSHVHSALETLCRTYWYPLYAFVRRHGHSPHDAEDLVQGFFAELLEKRWLTAADQDRGRFRSFLLTALKHYLANAWDRARARKRGAGANPVSLDALSAEQRYALEPTDDTSPDRLFDRRWALTLLERVLETLRTEYAATGRTETFDQLKEFLGGGGRGTPYAELAERLGTTEGALKVAVHRLRQRYRELLEAEIAHTVAGPDEVAAERRHLLAALSG